MQRVEVVLLPRKRLISIIFAVVMLFLISFVEVHFMELIKELYVIHD